MTEVLCFKGTVVLLGTATGSGVEVSYAFMKLLIVLVISASFLSKSILSYLSAIRYLTSEAWSVSFSNYSDD